MVPLYILLTTTDPPSVPSVNDVIPSKGRFYDSVRSFAILCSNLKNKKILKTLFVLFTLIFLNRYVSRDGTRRRNSEFSVRMREAMSIFQLQVH